jgi:cytochrome c-type biogenesis protein CcmH
VREGLDAGETPDSIVESLVAAFGEGVRGAPRATGLGLLLWALPAVVLGVGGIAVLWWLRGWGVRALPVPARHSGGDPGDLVTAANLARLAAEVRHLE